MSKKWIITYLGTRKEKVNKKKKIERQFYKSQQKLQNNVGNIILVTWNWNHFQNLSDKADKSSWSEKSASYNRESIDEITRDPSFFRSSSFGDSNSNLKIRLGYL